MKSRSIALSLALMVSGGCATGGVGGLLPDSEVLDSQLLGMAISSPAVGGQVASNSLVTSPVASSPIVENPVSRSLVARGTASGTPAILGTPIGDAVVSGSSLSSAAEQMDPVSLAAIVLRESNLSRRSHGAGGLVTDPALTRAAEAYARELAGRGEIEHLSPTPGRRTFRERISAAGAYPRLGGENLARITTSPASLGGRVVDAWLRSPGHRFNLLDPLFSKTGVGVWLGGDGIWYVVQLYATSS